MKKYCKKCSKWKWPGCSKVSALVEQISANYGTVDKCDLLKYKFKAMS